VVGVSCHEVPVLAVVSLAVDLGFAFSNVDTVLVGMAVQLLLVHDWQKKNNTEKQEQHEHKNNKNTRTKREQEQTKQEVTSV
jgi:L-lactate permease